MLGIGRVGLHHEPARLTARAHHHRRPAAGADTPDANATAPAAVPFATATGSAMRFRAGAGGTEGTGLVALPNAR